MDVPPRHDPRARTERRRKRTASSFARTAAIVAAVLLPLSVAWALAGSGPDSEAGAAPSAGVTATDPGFRAALHGDSQPVPTSPTRPAVSAKERLGALRHPLVGASRAEMIRAIGRPTRRATEGGAAMELLEYDIADEQYQVVVLNTRVVEVIRFR